MRQTLYCQSKDVCNDTSDGETVRYLDVKSSEKIGEHLSLLREKTQRRMQDTIECILLYFMFLCLFVDKGKKSPFSDLLL